MSYKRGDIVELEIEDLAYGGLGVAKPGGYVVFSLRTDLYEEAGFKEKQSALETQGKWMLAEASKQFQPLPKGEPEVFHQIWAYQV